MCTTSIDGTVSLITDVISTTDIITSVEPTSGMSNNGKVNV